MCESVVRVAGIDCGSERTGYGVVESCGRRHEMIAAGVIRASVKLPFPGRLKLIYDGLLDLLEGQKPDVVAVESVFYACNVQTALKLAHVRGVALLAAAHRGIPVAEYSPLEVKNSVVGFGRATKKQVQLMVGSLLRLREPVSPFDASDALAVALCHLALHRKESWTAGEISACTTVRSF